MSDSAAASPEASEAHVFQVSRISRALLAASGQGEDSLLAFLSKAVGDESLTPSQSNQAVLVGRRAQPANFSAMSRLVSRNGYHASCIVAKKHATVGLGFKSEKVASTLDPLCEIGFQALYSTVAEDHHSTGNGYLEVVRDETADYNGPIRGLHWYPSPEMWIAVDNDGGTHFEMDMVGTSRSEARLGVAMLPKFGDAKRFFELHPSLKGKSGARGTYSEVIHIPFPTALNRWYGLPNWLAAVPAIELMAALDQREFDFFINRGVPEFMLFLTGASISPKNWKIIENAIKDNAGLGNAHKSMAVNLPEQGAEAILHKLDLEGTDQGARYQAMTETLALKVVSAHQVPPLLAGVLIPGKLGASNELPNAIRAFQLLSIAPTQGVFEAVLGRTLGNPAKNGGLGLVAADFKHKTLTEELDVGLMDTSSRMRQTEPEAAAQGRDMAAGLKKELTDGETQVLAEFLAAALTKMREQRKAA